MMKKIKYLILLFILCLTCSFAPRQPDSQTFTVDFKQNLGYFIDVDTTEYTFNYGQKFILATSNIEKRTNFQPFDLVLTRSGDNYLTVNSKEDLFMINDVSKGWNLPTEYVFYILVPIDNYILTTSSFEYLEEVTDYFLDIPIEGYFDQTINEFITYQYNDRLVLSAKHNVGLFDNLKPVINNYNGLFISNVNNPVTLEDIKSHIRAYDDIDGDVTDRIIVEKDNYTSNNNVLGLHEIVFSVADNAQNKAYLTVNVKVVDNDAPIIEGPIEHDSYLSNPLDIDSIVSLYSVRDNYDDGVELKYVDNYTSNKNIVGDYDITFTAIDSSGNKTSKIVKVHVKDDIKPIISGNASYTTTVYKEISYQEIIDGLTVSDIGDPSLSNSDLINLEDNYTNSNDSIGIHDLKFQVKDASNNLSDIFIVKVNVVDSKLPEFYIDEFIINCELETELSNDYIMNLLNECKTIDFNNITDKERQIVETYNDYNNSVNEGQYKISYKVSYDDGTVKDLDVIINKKILEPIVVPWYTKVGIYYRYYSMMINTKISHFIDSIFNFILRIFR